MEGSMPRDIECQVWDTLIRILSTYLRKKHNNKKWKKGKRKKQEQIVLERCATLNFEKLLAFPYHEFPQFINPTWISGKQSILLIFLTKFFILFFHWSSKLVKQAVGGFLCLKASYWLPWWLCVWLLLCHRVSTHKSLICGSPFFVSYWDDFVSAA